MDQGPTYRLVFTHRNYVFVLTVSGGNGYYSWVNGVGNLGWIRLTQNFFQLPRYAMHLHLVIAETFPGKMS